MSSETNPKLEEVQDDKSPEVETPEKEEKANWTEKFMSFDPFAVAIVIGKDCISILAILLLLNITIWISLALIKGTFSTILNKEEIQVEEPEKLLRIKAISSNVEIIEYYPSGTTDGKTRYFINAPDENMSADSVDFGVRQH